MTRLGKWLGLLRGERGMSVRAAASGAACSSAYFNEVERGLKHPAAAMAAEMATAVGGSREEAVRLWSLDRSERTVSEATAAGYDVADKMRLPTIRICGDCGWFRSDDCSCRKSNLGYVAKTEPPPDGCWLRGRVG